MTCCNGGRDDDLGCGEDPSVGAVVLHFPCFYFQGVFILGAGGRGHVSLYQRVDFSPTRGDAQFVRKRGFVRHPVCVSTREIGDVPLIGEEEKTGASCVFWGLSEHLRVPSISLLERR